MKGNTPSRTVSNIYTFPIQKLGYDVTGFDIDEEAIGIARTYAREQGLEHIRFELGNAQQMSQLADESFDHVFSFQAFRYFSDLGAALREVHRVLRPGGVSVIDYPNRYSPFYSIYKRVKGHRYDFADYNYLSGADAEDHYRRAGFKEVSSELMLFSPPTTPTPLLPIMKGIDAVLESIPGVSSLAGFLMVRGEK